MAQVLGPIGSYDNSRVITALVGATAVRPGDLLKFSAGLLVPLSAGDKQIQVYVALGYGAVSATISACPLQDIVLRIKVTGTPTIGLTYGVSDQRTIDSTDTTNKLLTVVKVGTGGGLDSGFASAIQYGLAS